MLKNVPCGPPSFRIVWKRQQAFDAEDMNYSDLDNHSESGHLDLVGTR